VTITATYGGSRRTAALTINAAPSFPLADKTVVVSGNFTTGGVKYPIQITVFGGASVNVVTTLPPNTIDLSKLYVFMLQLNAPQWSGSSVSTSSVDGPLSLLISASGIPEPILTANFSLTFKGSSVGRSVTGTLKMSTPQRTLDGALDGTILSIGSF
jgi:hypothetical protein